MVEYDFDTAPKLKVPGDRNSQDDKLFFYEGARRNNSLCFNFRNPKILQPRLFFLQLEKGKNDVIKGWVKISRTDKNISLTIEAPALDITENLHSNDALFPIKA